MNRHNFPGRSPHGHLDVGFAISGLHKEQPLFDFGRSERAQRLRRRPLPWEAPVRPEYDSEEFDEGGRRRVAATDWVWQSPGLLDPSCDNNSAAARRQGDQPSNRQRLERHLRQRYGNQLFRKGRYVATDQVGPQLLPRSDGSIFQAVRSHIVGPLPAEVFEDTSDGGGCATESVFEWCDGGNTNWSNSTKFPGGVPQRLARRSARKIAMRHELDDWIYLHFRVRRVAWEFLVHEERTNFNLVDLYSDGVLDKWTMKLRFRMFHDAPMKHPLMAFLSRMGLETDPDIVFTTDGFYGDLLVGGLRNRNCVPHRVVSYNTTAHALSLQNGDCLFVSSATSTLRANVETQIEMARRRSMPNEVHEDLDQEYDDQIESEEETETVEDREEESSSEEEEDDVGSNDSNLAAARRYKRGAVLFA